MSPVTPSQLGDYTWEVARWFPKQGRWTEAEYLELTERSNQMVELTEGRLEFLAMPTYEHQLIVIHLLVLLREFVLERNLGVVLIAPHPTQISDDKYREPDVLFKLKENFPAEGEKYFHGADLVMEVVSEDAESNRRDYEEKVRDYSQAGIAEYWIVDPQQHKITVLTLDGDKYAEHCVAPDGKAASKLLDGFAVDVDAVFAAGKLA